MIAKGPKSNGKPPRQSSLRKSPPRSTSGSSALKQTVKVGSRTLTLTNLDKVLYPETGFTKGQVIEYYIRIAPVLLPHVKNRPVSLKRYPNGVDKEFFYQKNCPVHRPEWLETLEVPRESRNGEPIQFCVIKDQASLVWMANLASIELHTYLSRSNRFDRPTMMVFDLDPGPGMTLLDCCRVGLELRNDLEELGLECFAKTSGGKGLHIATPLNIPTVTFEQTKPFARALAAILEREDPTRITTNMRKDLRKGKVFIDWSQNDKHKTTVSVYSLRARPHPTVSMPLTWDEIAAAVDDDDDSGLVFEAPAALERVKQLGDLFAPLLTLKQRLPKIDLPAVRQSK